MRLPARGRLARLHRVIGRVVMGLVVVGGAALGSAGADDPPPPAPPAAPRAAPEPEQEDQVTLENGSTFRGNIVEEDATKVVLQRVAEDGGVSKITFPKSRISTIRRAGPRGEQGPGPVVVRDAWFLLRSGGETVGTRHLVLRSVRSAGVPGFRIEETVVQLPQGRRIPQTRVERSEDTDLRFLPRRMAYRESLEAAVEGGAPRFERSVTGTVKDDVWSAVESRGGLTQRRELSLPPGTRGPLGLREFLLREPRASGLLPRSVLDPAQSELVDVTVGFAALGSKGSAEEPEAVDELQWVEGDVRRILRVRGSEIVDETLGEGLVAVESTESQARAIEANAAADPKARDVTLAEQGLVLTLPGPDWVATRPVASALDAGWRLVARLSSAALLADARVEWDPEGTPPGQTPDQAEAALLARLKPVCPDLAVAARRKPVAGLPGAFTLTLYGTLRDTPVYTLALVLPRGAGQTVVLAACPETAWDVGRAVLERLLASVRPL